MGETVADLVNGGAFVTQATDPVVSNVSTPADFAAQFPTPLDTAEILDLCDEVSLLQAIPDLSTSLKQETYREMTSLAFSSGTTYLGFSDGACPEEYTHDGSNTTVTLKNIGSKKSLTLSDIMHSAAIAAANWNGINTLVGPGAAGEGLPGTNGNTFIQEHVANVKEKEVRLGMTLVLNGEDNWLAVGNTSTSALQYDGIETWVTSGNGAHTNDNSSSGTFSASSFDRFVAEGCAKPTLLAGHPQAIQEMMSGYFQLGFQGSQVINVNSGDRVIPGFNFDSFVNTGVGRLKVVADTNFSITDMGNGAFQSNIYALRMNHNGAPLVYRRTQIPLSLRDLTPGCTSISFELWKKTALIVKALCAQSVWTGQFTGRVSSTCTAIF